MAARYTLLLCGILCFTGCFSPGTKRFADVPRHDARPTVKEIKAEGSWLRISIVQDGGVVFVAGITPVVMEGDVYLTVQDASSVIHTTEFTVDLSDERFPRDWKNRLYWIEDDAISSPVNPFIKHYREISRSKIVIE